MILVSPCGLKITFKQDSEGLIDQSSKNSQGVVPLCLIYVPNVCTLVVQALMCYIYIHTLCIISQFVIQVEGLQANVLWTWNFLFMEDIKYDVKLRTGEAQRNKRWKDQFNLNKTKRTSGKTVWIEYRIEAEQTERKKKKDRHRGEIKDFDLSHHGELCHSPVRLVPGWLLHRAYWSRHSLSAMTQTHCKNTSRKRHLHLNLNFLGGFVRFDLILCLHRCYSHVNTSHTGMLPLH